MSELITHECGIALVRLRKPLAHYVEKHGNALYGFNQLFMLMEKQHNRGQDGAGIGCVKLNMPLGQPYMFRERSDKSNALLSIFETRLDQYDALLAEGRISPVGAASVKEHFDFGGEVLLGHLRYGTSGNYDIECCHPYLRPSNWPTKSLMVMGNFNMTNTEDLNQVLIDRGQHPVFSTDTQTVLEEIGFHLDEEHTRIYREERAKGTPGADIPAVIAEKLDLAGVLRAAATNWDGGYAISGVVGHGDAFVLRDPNGIRPCYYYVNEDVAAVASERVPLQTAFGVNDSEIREVPPGQALLLRRNGDIEMVEILEPRERKSCSFERIYFSRGNDAAIYKERKALGAALVPAILREIGNNLTNSVFSYIPNTAESAYYGLMDALRLHRRAEVRQALLDAQAAGKLTPDLLDALILDNWPRGEKIAHKDIKLRTFISQEKSRTKLASHVYDITYGVVQPNDFLVVVDDSIVRGTTLKQSILKILARTNPTKLVIASTAPQIRYPDCYGIDMSELGRFIAFQAAVSLLRQSGREKLLDEVADACRAELAKPLHEMRNAVKAVYAPFTEAELAREITNLVRPKMEWAGEIVILFQTIPDLHTALPGNSGDWYFSGDYPTPGGTRTANQAFLHFFSKRGGRAY